MRLETRTLHEQFLIVSDPPHGRLDVRLAAPCIGLTPAQVRLKTDYPVPEIWVADRSRIRIAATAQTLRLAGHRLAVVKGSQLLLPPQTVVESFCFRAPGLVVRVKDGSEVEIPYDAPVTGVLCKTKCPDKSGSTAGPGFARTIDPVALVSDTHGAGGHAKETMSGEPDKARPVCVSTFLDLYVPTSTGLIRVTFHESETDFTPGASEATDDAADRLMDFVSDCEKHLVNLRLDRRLEDMLPRRPVSYQTTARYSVSRTGYSFASARLPRLLGEIAPGLDALNQCELSSRLVYLTATQRESAPRRAA